MPVEEAIITTLKNAINDLKNAVAESEDTCFTAILISNSATGKLQNMAQRIRAKTENNEEARELAQKIIHYLTKEYPDMLQDYINAVLLKYYVLLRAAKGIAKKISVEEHKKLARLQEDIDKFESVREKVNEEISILLGNIYRRFLPEQMSLAEYSGIADDIYVFTTTGEHEKPYMDELGEMIRMQVESRFRELIEVSEKVLEKAKSL